MGQWTIKKKNHDAGVYKFGAHFYFYKNEMAREVSSEAPDNQKRIAI